MGIRNRRARAHAKTHIIGFSLAGVMGFLALLAIAVAVSLGAPAQDYAKDGAVGHTVAEALRPFELSMNYCNAAYQPMFAFHTIDSNAGYDAAALQVIEQSAADYLAYLNRLAQAD